MTLAVMAPAISAIEEFLAKRAERFDLTEIMLISWWPDRAGTFKRELDYARKDGELSLARKLAADPDADFDAIIRAHNRHPYDRIVSLGSDKDGNEFLVEESQAGRHWTAHPEQLT